MRLCSVALTLLPIFFLVAKTDASANTTAYSAPTGASSFTGDRSGILVSEPPNARDEERAPIIEDVRGNNKFTTLLFKSAQALWKQDAKSRLELKAAWWRMKNVSPHKIYTTLKLDEVNEGILSNPSFHVWVKYVRRYNVDHPNNQVSIVKKLLTKCNEDKLAMLLEQAKEEEDTLIREIGTALQSDQMSIWAGRNLAPIEIYKLLQYSQTSPGLLTGRAYHVWNRYFSEFNPGLSMSLFDQLYSAFGDAGLSSLLLVALRSKETKKQAKTLQAQLRFDWLSKGIKPELVFKYLMLDTQPEHLLDRQEINVWLRYAAAYMEETKTIVTIKGTIESYYDEDAIETIINTAKTSSGERLANFVAATEA